MYHIKLPANRSNTNAQLSLALAWDRSDIAKNEIFTTSNKTNYQVILSSSMRYNVPSIFDL